MNYVPKYTLTDKIRSNLQEIERIKDKVRGSRILPAAEASLRFRASVESVHSSTSIEGNPLNANEVRAVISSDKLLTKAEYAEIEVKNYKAALDFIDKRRHGDKNLSYEDILELHKIITHRLLDKSRNGKIRKNPVYIENQYHEVLYTAIEAKKAESALRELVAWANESAFSIHPVIIAAVLHFRIAAIHPFADGNGRTARAATLLFLALNNYDCNGALVLDSFYATDRRAYYSILQLTNGKSYETSLKSDLTPWLEYFTDGFLTSLHVLDAEVRILGSVLVGGKDTRRLDPEDQDILSYVTKFGSITVAEAAAFLPELSRRSIQRRFKKLIESGYLVMQGEARDAIYVVNAKGR